MKLSFGPMIVATALVAGTPALAEPHHHHHHHKDHHQEAAMGSPTTEDLNAKSLANARAGTPPAPEASVPPGSMPAAPMMSPPMMSAPTATVPSGTGTVAPPMPPVPSMPESSPQ